MSYFLCKPKFDKLFENGLQKTVTEQYLVDALSFTEAEAQIVGYISPFISSDLTIQDISRTNYSELFLNPDYDKYYKVKCNFIGIDENTGNEKKTTTYFLVQADSVDKANELFTKGMKGTLSDYEIEATGETKILDVILYNS